ncbi:MAG: LysR substrate-binding domain-containing protein [Pseudomonadales bacterium]|nr:LysR substrate-binding domain-containing protein [Pseudomonadales bacterium]
MNDLNEMLIFARVVKEGGFTAAAKAMGLQKSFVSRKVALLEERLEMTLLERTTRRVDLTDAGEIYYEHCQRVLLEVEAADLAVAQMHTIPTGTLKISVPVAMGSTIFSKLISDFLKVHSQIKVELLLSDRSLELLDSGIDLAFGSGPMPSANFISVKLGEAQWVMCASPDYVATNGAPNDLEDLPNHGAVLFGSMVKPNRWTFVHEGSRQDIYMQERLLANDLSTVKNCVIEGVGISILPVLLAADAIKTGHLVQLLPQYKLRTHPVYVAYPSSRHLSAKLQAFFNFARSTGARRDPWGVTIEEALKQEQS